MSIFSVVFITFLIKLVIEHRLYHLVSLRLHLIKHSTNIAKYIINRRILIVILLILTFDFFFLVSSWWRTKHCFHSISDITISWSSIGGYTDWNKSRASHHLFINNLPICILSMLFCLLHTQWIVSNKII